MVELIPQTDGAKNAIHGNEKLIIPFFPYRLGRESRHAEGKVSQEILERRIGKTPQNNDFYLIDPGRMLHISREHFLIEKTPENSYTIFDRMSACGTTVHSKNGIQTCIAHRCPVNNGDIIIVGGHSSPYVFKFTIINDEPA